VHVVFKSSHFKREPAEHLQNFKPQIMALHAKRGVIPHYDSVKMLYLNKPVIKVKTEETVKKIRKTGRTTRRKPGPRKGSNRATPTTPTNNNDVFIIDIPLQEGEITKVLDLQQVYHHQSKRVHILARVVKYDFNI
jgi:hypothetical protein